MLVKQVYFPSAVYSALMPEFLASVRAVFDEYMSAARLKDEIDPLHPMLMSANFSKDARIAEFSHHVANTGWNILQSQGYRMQGRATFFAEMWGQQHGRTSSVAEHVHPGAQISGFYFLDTPPGSSKIRLHDPRPAKAMINLPEDAPGQPSMASPFVTITPQAGMLFFANAWLPQALTRHGAEQPMSVVHFNLGVLNAQAKPAPAAGDAIVI